MGNQSSKALKRSTKSVLSHQNAKKLTGDNVNISDFEGRDSVLEQEMGKVQERGMGRGQQNHLRHTETQRDSPHMSEAHRSTSDPHHHHAHDHNPFRDPRFSSLDSSFSMDPSHRQNMEKIMHASEERVSEEEKKREEDQAHRFSSQLVNVSQLDVQPMYENTVGNPNSPLAMHHSPKSEVMSHQQNKHKYDDLEGMYKVVDVMNFMRDLRSARMHKVKEEKAAARSAFRGKFYGRATSGEGESKESTSTVKTFSQEEMIDGFSSAHRIPLQDVQTIVEHFQFPNHITMRDKEYAFWHDFELDSMWSTPSDASAAGKISEAPAEKQQNSAPKTGDAIPHKKARSSEEIESAMLKELQELEYRRRSRENQDQL
eukprot:CAMPEP_0117435006 /NCGR_PEP_ID=MMETSP0759-20121206/250_1 /TAXON_ID=63605 /ORGANISM="Percolomonas cosmopolitus, Strain WS" /LENGTH=371 /DNA_ID=CAMNT_0005226523 /DNA_START=100 /DNA_END=1215 /DNA_ORIENTATION=+